MTQEQLRMQMLAGIITESQYKEKMEEIDSYGRVGKQYPAPGYEKMASSTQPSSSPQSIEQLRKKAGDLYEDILDHNIITYNSSDYIDIVIEKSVPYNTLKKIAKKNGGSLGIGMNKVIRSEFLTEKELKEIIRVLESAINFAKKSGESKVDFYYLGYDRGKGEWYDSRDKE
jgi:hypothetical protein